MNNRVILVSCAIAALTGCATPDFKAQLDTYKAVETKRADEKAEKYKALSAIATGADAATKQVALQAWQAVAMVDSLGNGSTQAQAMPQPPATAFDKTLQAISIVAPVAASITGSVMSYKLGTNQAQYARDVALGDQRARVDTVTAVATGMGTLGSNGFAAIRDTAGYGLSVASSLGLKPTTVVNGNGNAVNGSATDNSVNTTTTTTSTNNCTGGSSGSTTSTTGNPTGAPGGSAPCTISK